MRINKRIALVNLLLFLYSGSARADYTKGSTMFELYAGGSSISGHYNQPGVSHDEQYYADSGGLIGGQFLYYISDSPCVALGVDISHASLDDHNSFLLLPNRATTSSADYTAGLFVARLAYPKGRFRPYVQGGLGAQHTTVTLNGTPFNSTWSDTGTTETRSLMDDGHVGAALEGGVGAYVYFTERFFIGAEYKWVGFIGKDFDPTAAGAHEGLLSSTGRFVSPSIGFTLGYGF